MSFTVGELLSGVVWQRHQPLILSNVAELRRGPRVAEQVESPGVLSIGVLPLTTARRRLGTRRSDICCNCAPSLTCVGGAHVAHTDALGTFISSQRRDHSLAILPKPQRSQTEAA